MKNEAQQKRFINFKTLRRAAVASIALALLSLPLFTSTADPSGMVSVIVELRTDPGAVYVAKARQSGTAISDTQLQAYREQLRVAQNQFLNELSSRGIAAQLKTANVANFEGGITPVELRYTLAFNGVALSVFQSAIPALKAMPQVKAVHPNTALRVTLDNAVSY
ncbi:MAG TPA: hypothetical protein VI750_03165, partial [Pyrinomonadaceae bacterium]|nr:hypothetical protein [Pyrinomonadaceae bacterium]